MSSSLEAGWPQSKTLRGLLMELKDGYTLYKPILIEVERGTRDSFSHTIERTMTQRKPLDWAEQYGREYAGHQFLVLGSSAGGSSGKITIGRSRRCDARVDNDSVSKMHASLVFDRANNGYYLIDEHSRNGTSINGQALVPEAPSSIWAGAYVSFGDAVYVFIDPPTLRKLSKIAIDS